MSYAHRACPCSYGEAIYPLSCWFLVPTSQEFGEAVKLQCVRTEWGCCSVAGLSADVLLPLLLQNSSPCLRVSPTLILPPVCSSAMPFPDAMKQTFEAAPPCPSPPMMANRRFPPAGGSRHAMFIRAKLQCGGGGGVCDVWKLPVLCPCIRNPGDPCKEACMKQDLRALGVCMHRARGQGTCLAHPSAFTEHWALKLGPPLQSAWAEQDVSLANLYTSVLINALPFIRSWGALLLSCAAWINMGLLCGHSTAVTLRAAHRALTRVLARTPYAVEPSRKCITFLIPHMPASKTFIAQLVCTWLQRSANWDE